MNDRGGMWVGKVREVIGYRIGIGNMFCCWVYVIEIGNGSFRE